MMQPHDDGDCAMEEAGALLHSSPLPAVNSKTDASSPSNQQLTNDDALVGARKRKAIRVVKHQQVRFSRVYSFRLLINRAVCVCVAAGVESAESRDRAGRASRFDERTDRW